MSELISQRRRRNRTILSVIAGLLAGVAVLFISAWSTVIIGVGDYYGDGFLFYNPISAASLFLAIFIGVTAYRVTNKETITVEGRIEIESGIVALIFWGVVGQVWVELFYGSEWKNVLLFIFEILTIVVAANIPKMWTKMRLKARPE